MKHSAKAKRSNETSAYVTKRKKKSISDVVVSQLSFGVRELILRNSNDRHDDKSSGTVSANNFRRESGRERLLGSVKFWRLTEASSWRTSEE
jgi:hypothetical protein